MKNNTINKKEIEKFSKIAEEWWDPEGKFKPLHKFNPIRISYIKNHIINIGISGGKKGDCSVGQLFLINKVSDEKSKLSFNLGSQHSFGLQNNEITTVSKPVVDNNFKGEGLVDMEAYEICKTVNDLEGLNRLLILKIVSDHMDMKHHISANQVQSLIKQKIPVIDKFIRDLRKLQN